MRSKALACGLLAGALAAVAPTPSAGQQTPPRGPAELVVDMCVIGKDGTPVTELQPSDVTISVDGQVRRVTSLTFVDRATPAQPDRGAPTAGPRVSSNDAALSGRLVLVVLDELTLQFGGVRGAAEAVGGLVEAFGPLDRLALAAIPGPRMLVEFGRDRQAIVEAIRRAPGGVLPIDPANRGMRLTLAEAAAIDRGNDLLLQQVNARECDPTRMSPAEVDSCRQSVKWTAAEMVVQARDQTRRFGQDLRTLLAGLRSIDAPKVVIVLSQGFVSREAPAELRALASDSAAAQTSIYAVRLDRSTFDVGDRGVLNDMYRDANAARAGLEALVGRASGAVFEAAGAQKGAFQRVAQEVSSYYLVRVDGNPNDRDGKPHRVAITVNRPDVTVRARPEYVFGARAPAIDDKALLERTLRAPLIARGLPVQVATFNLADDDPSKVRVLIIAEVDRDQAARAPVSIAYTLANERGEVRVAFAQRMDLTTTPSGRLGFVGQASVVPGRYSLKLAAVHAGRAGSVEHAFAARLTSAASLQLGDLMIGDGMAGDVTSSTSVDGHVRGDRICGLLQIASDLAVPKDATLTFEVAKDEGGPAIISTPFLMPDSPSRARMWQVAVDARLLPPGGYVGRLLVSSGGKELARLGAPFTLERAASGMALGAAAAAAPRFTPAQVLDADVLGPFLDDLAGRATEASRPAIERARAGRLAEAMQAAKAGGASDPAPAFIRGLTLFQEGQFQAASDAFRDSSRASPEFLVPAFYIGACYAAGGRDTQAVNAWQTSLLGLEGFPVVYRLLGEALSRAGDFERALEILDEAASRWPDDQDMALRVTNVAVEARHYDRALRYVDRAVERRPAGAELLFAGMQALFAQLVTESPVAQEALLDRLRRYRDLYVAAGGEQTTLVAEWVAFAERLKK